MYFLKILVLVFLLSGSQLFASARAQQVKLDIRVDNCSLIELIDLIKQKSGISFLYFGPDVEPVNRLSIQAKQKSVPEILDMALKGTSLNYSIEDNLIILKKNAPEKEKMVKGTVKDTQGSPLPAVSIVVKGTTIGVATNKDGQYTLRLPENNNIILVFSFMGMETQEIPWKGEPILNITLKEKAKQMEEVVITGFQSLKKETFTGSSVKLKAEDLQTQGVADVSRMLEGKAAGVFIQNVSGTFGTAPKIRIRGVTSINGENKPLWVVDGIVLEDVVNISNDQLASGDPTTLLGSSVAGINPNDIETFDILKDAAATALYGARAMNGVVVITTKRGKTGKPVVSYSGNFTVRSKPSYRQYNIMNSADQMSVYAELERKGHLSSDIVNASSSGVYGNMYRLINTYDEANERFLLENTPEARAAYLQKYALANTDWFDLLFQNSLLQEHTLSISSGSERSKTYASIGFLHDEGWTIADQVSRYTLNFRNDYTISPQVRVAVQTTGSVRQQKAPGSLNRQSNLTEGSYSRDFDINPFSYALNASRALRAYNENGEREFYTMNYAPFNILNELDNNKLNLNMIDLKLQGELSYTIIPGLHYDFTGALRYVRTEREHEIHENANMAEAYRADGTATIRSKNKFLYRDPDHPNDDPVVVLPYGGFYNTSGNLLLNYDIRNSFTYHKIFHEIHEFNALIGQQIKGTERKKTSTTGYGYQYNMGGIPYIDYRILKQMIESQFDYYGMEKNWDRFAAFYANADYTYDRRYSVSGTLRYDGSNMLGQATKSRWLPTWNISGKWIIHNERFMQNIHPVNTLSLRASYGLTASMPPVSNAKAVFYNETTYRPSGGAEPSTVMSALGNKDLTWEKSYQLNIGLETSLFNHRITVDIDYFRRNSFDLISRIKTSGIGGYMWKYANYADLHAHGIDVTLGFKPVATRDFSWNINFTFGSSKNEIRNAENKPNAFSLVKAEGGNLNDYPVNSLFSICFDGLDPASGLPTFINEKGKKGSFGYDMQSENIEYLKYEGPVDPKYTGGLNSTFRWKDLSFNVFFTYQAGNKIRLNPSFKSYYSDLDALPSEFAERWSIPGDEKHTHIPSIMDASTATLIGNRYPYNSYNYSTVRVAKGDFIRLKTMSLNYRLPSEWLKHTHLFTRAELMLTGRNLWLLYADKKLNGQDPEFFNSGGVAQPLQREFILTLNLGF